MKRTIIDASQLELEDKVVTIKRVTKVPANLNRVLRPRGGLRNHFAGRAEDRVEVHVQREGGAPESGDDGQDRKRDETQSAHEQPVEDVRRVFVAERPRARVERHQEPGAGIRQEEESGRDGPRELPGAERLHRLVPERTPQALREEHDHADHCAGDDERVQPQEATPEESADAHPLAPAAVVGVCEHEAHQEEEELDAQVSVSAYLRHRRDVAPLPAVRLGDVEQGHEKPGCAT